MSTATPWYEKLRTNEVTDHLPLSFFIAPPDNHFIERVGVIAYSTYLHRLKYLMGFVPRRKSFSSYWKDCEINNEQVEHPLSCLENALQGKDGNLLASNIAERLYSPTTIMLARYRGFGVPEKHKALENDKFHIWNITFLVQINYDEYIGKKFPPRDGFMKSIEWVTDIDRVNLVTSLNYLRKHMYNIAREYRLGEELIYRIFLGSTWGDMLLYWRLHPKTYQLLNKSRKEMADRKWTNIIDAMLDVLGSDMGRYAGMML